MGAARSRPFSAADNGQFIEAAGDGDLDTVKRLVAQGADPAYRDERGMNAIMYALYHNRLPVAKYILSLPGDHPANVNNDGNTALINAVFNGSYEMAALLIKDGRCDPTIANRDGNTAVKVAVEWKLELIVELLLSDTRVVKALRA